MVNCWRWKWFTVNSPRPPAHYHPSQEEHFEFLNGTLHTEIGGQRRTYEAGDRFTVPIGTHHWMHNTSSEFGKVIWQVRPAMKTETFFKTLWGLAIDGKTNNNGVPNILQIAVLFREYDREFRLSKPPYPLQKILFYILAPLGRLSGYRAKYDEYSEPGTEFQTSGET